MLVIGVGSSGRGDDAAGLRVAGKLRAAARRSLRVIEREGDLARLLDDWAGEDTVVVIDATRSRSSAGTVRCFEAGQGALPAVFRGASTHLWGVAEAVELARVLGRLPRRLVVYGIEGRSFEPGTEPTPEVRAAVDAVAEAILVLAPA